MGGALVAGFYDCVEQGLSRSYFLLLIMLLRGEKNVIGIRSRKLC